MLKFQLPSTPIANKIIERLKNITPVINETGEDVVKTLQQNIVNEGGDPDNGKAWEALSSRTIARKRQIGAFLTILRQFDKLRRGIKVVRQEARSFDISVVGDASKYFYLHQTGAPNLPRRRMLGFPQECRKRAKLRLGKHLKK